ncbi:hypothetical protein RHSP_82858 [Rhizobium freirei PRF 81]|uniref:DUF2934 domain-containing protein n=1 Tax=Rhizobium freirei PRF 81 TaxID=363754 RepID=N6V4I3_9HYPH|nr:DUF2934 domain-containing protein [Rhizobium freirei]ENN88795.1 hypothetical protein RHSP_82858 [Rhizobium freirei PRF 81]
MLESRDEWIKKRAYAIWEEEGYPSGRDVMHWQQADSERVALEKSVGKESKLGVKAKATRKPATTAGIEEIADKPVAKPTTKKTVKAKA